MKRILLPLLLLLLFVSISCKKNKEEPTPKVDPSPIEDPIPIEETKYFNFTVGPNYNLDNEYRRIRNWVLVYSEENELLINLELENETEYDFSDLELPQSGLNLQIITYTEQRGYADTIFSDIVSINTYTDIVPGHWKFTKSEDKQYEPIGTFEVNLNDIGLGDDNISEMKSSYDYAHFFSAPNNYQLQRFIENEYLWLLMLKYGEAPVYKKISNIDSGSQIELDNNDLEVMTSYVDIVLPQNEEMFVYVETEDDYDSEFWDYNMIFYNGYDDGETSIRTYFPGDVFPGYYSYIFSRMGNIKNYQYKSRGSIPHQLKILDVDLVIENTSINNLKAKVVGNSDMVTLGWKYNSFDEDVNFEYKVNFPVDSDIHFSAPGIPEKVLVQLPSDFNINSFEYEYFLANEYDVFDGYQDYVQSYYIDNDNLYSQKVERQWQYIYHNNKSMEEFNDMKIIEGLKRNPYQ